MTIKNVARILFDREIKRAQGGETKNNREGGKVGSTVGNPVDSSHISSEAKEINANQIGITNSIDSAQKIGKAENINEVKERIGSGYYDSTEVLEEIASSIINAEFITRADDNSDKYEIFRGRINNNFYDSKEVIETAASRLLKYLK